MKSIMTDHAENTKTKVVRDHAWVEREYNREKYPLVLKAAEAARAAGETTLPRAVGMVIAKERGAMALATRKEAVVDGRKRVLPLAFASAGIAGLVTEALAEACGPKTHTIVELGAGWGRNLFNLHLSGGAPRGARYYALEFAAAARMTAELMAPLEDGLAFKVLPFDFHDPSYTGIAASKEPALVATVHAVEQIPYLKPEVFTALLARLPNLAGVHLEPVGWQLPPELWSGRAPCATAAYAESHDYNRNFWALLCALEAQGTIVIDDIQPDIVGLNPQNPSTLIRWHAKR